MTARITDVCFSFPGADRPVLDGVSLTFEPGSTTAVLGPSGAGKSTLLRLMAGLLPLDRGSVVLPPVAGAGVPVAMVFQDPRLLPWLTVRGNFDFALEAAGVAPTHREARWRPLLDAVGLADVADVRPGALSGGMAQRVGVVRALSLRPGVLLLDEPFGAVDPLLRDQLQAMLSALLAGGDTTAVLVTHDVREAAVLADQVAILGGTPSAVVAQLSVDLPRPRDGLGPSVSAVARDIRSALAGAMPSAS